MLRFEELPEVNSERWLSLEDLPGEEWRDVVGHEQYFLISNYGRLKRKERYVYCNRNKSYSKYKEKIMRLYHNKLGYVLAELSACGTRVRFNVHHNVADAFLPNPNNYPYVNHKDENPRNNTITNLEWCTPKYNSNYGSCRKKIRDTRIEKGYAQAVVLYDYDGNFIKEYKTAKDAALDNGMTRKTVSNCCENLTPTAKGLHFRYKGDNYEKRKVSQCKIFYKVFCKGKLLFETFDCKAMCERINVNYRVFRRFFIYRKGTYQKLEGYCIKAYLYNGEKYIIENGKTIKSI